MLTGELVRLRAITPADHDVLLAIAADLDTWEQRTPGAPAPLARATWDERQEQRRASGEGAEFAIEADGTLVGRCVLTNVDSLTRHGEVGIALLPEHCGHGYGTDALRVLAQFAFQRWNLRRLHLCTIASNAAAFASYRKVGFVEEGRRREHVWIDGRYEDEILMGLLRSEWTGRPLPHPTETDGSPDDRG